MVSAIKCELEMQKDFTGEPVETVYLGGGTPSLLPTGDIASILQTIRENYSLQPGAEVTLEANPDDISEDSLRGWKQAGINRLSIGIQSFFDEDLKAMNRAHSATQAQQALIAAKSEFSNITADLIFGIPGLSANRWMQNVEMMISFGIPHLSCYALTVEPQTPLAKMIREKKIAAPSPEEQSEQFLWLVRRLENAGYEHYEISNFALPGFRSRHNSAYWSLGPGGKGKKYLGIGPSAHSYNGSFRQWNISNNQQYIRSIGTGVIPAEKETLSDDQRLNEYVMTSLRKSEGIALDSLDPAERERLLRISEKYRTTGMLRIDEWSIRLTLEGKLFADRIAADLFK